MCPARRLRLQLPSCEGERGGRGPVGTPHPTRARDLPGGKKGRGPFKNRARHPLPLPGRAIAKNNGEPMGGGSKGAKGGRCPRSLGAGLKGELGLGARFSEALACGSPSSAPPAHPSPGARAPAGDAGARGCAGMRGDARCCRRGPGLLWGRVTEQAKPRAGSPLPPAVGVRAPSPQPRSPQSARGPPQEPGWGPSAPRALTASLQLCLSLRLALQYLRPLGSPRSGREPRSRLRALSLPGPRPPRAGTLGFLRADRLRRRPTDS